MSDRPRRLHRPLDLLELASVLGANFSGTTEGLASLVAETLDALMGHSGLNGRCERCLGAAVVLRGDGQLNDCPYCLGGYELAQTKTLEEFWDADAAALKDEKPE